MRRIDALERLDLGFGWCLIVAGVAAVFVFGYWILPNDVLEAPLSEWTGSMVLEAAGGAAVLLFGLVTVYFLAEPFYVAIMRHRSGRAASSDPHARG